MKQKLTVNQQKFADEYIKSGNATKSYLLAGYKVSDKVAASSANRLLRNGKVRAYIDSKMSEISNSNIAEGKEVLEYLTAVMRGKEKENVLIGLGMGEQEISEMNVGAKDRIKAAELIGKRYALFTDKVDLTSGDINIKIGDYDEDD